MSDGRPMDRARQLAAEIFEQPHWKTAERRGELTSVTDLTTDVAAAIREPLRLLERWLAWFAADADPRDANFGGAPNLIEIVDATIKLLQAARK